MSGHRATGRVICVGDLMVDIIARLRGPLAPGSDTPSEVELVGGGSAANTACWLAFIGAQASLVAVVGDDEFGRQTRADLRSHGVESHVAVEAGRPTGRCIVLVDPAGERTMIPDPGANANLSAKHIESAGLSGTDHLYLSGYALLSASARPAALVALDRARNVGASISIDVASSSPIIGIGRDLFLSWLGTDLLVFANLDEARALTGESDAMSAAQKLAERAGAAIVKTGRQGAICAADGAVIEVPTVPIEPRDTTGAGDAFAAGFLASWTSGKNPVESIREGHRLARHCCRLVGGRPKPPGPSSCNDLVVPTP
jgi:ribokinase